MVRLPSILASASLPVAELSALRLDGELFALADGFTPLDTLVSPVQRAAGLELPRSDRVIAALGTAAWVWGAAETPPRRSEVIIPAGERVNRQPLHRLMLRECVVGRSDWVPLAGVRVTSPLRTAVDLCRFREQLSAEDVDAVRRLAESDGFLLADAVLLLERRRNLHHKNRALERLARILPVAQKTFWEAHPVGVGPVAAIEPPPPVPAVPVGVARQPALTR